MNEAKLAELFGGKKRYALLRLLYLNPARRFTNTELVRASGVVVSNASRWLRHWAELGLVEMQVDGRNTTYKASSDPLLSGLSDIVLRNDAIVDDIRQALPTEVETAAIFGSQARGNEHAGSDIDVLVLGGEDLSEIRVNAALKAVGRKHDRVINATVIPTNQFLEQVRTGEDFVVSVTRQKTIPLKGHLPYAPEFDTTA